MKFYRFALPALAVALVLPLLSAAQYGQNQGPPPDGDRMHEDRDHGGWDAPPPEFREHEVKRRGFHDGMEAARDDFQTRHRPLMEHRREFRHPPAPPELRDEYREGFRRGYEIAFSHLRGDSGGDHDHDHDHFHDRY